MNSIEQALLLPPGLLQQTLADWREQQARIGLTNGCFDVLHPGHEKLLEFCAEHCDRLIVALNDDASVRRLKGRERPINSLEDRAARLARLSGVDAVTFFGDDTPLTLIQQLRPDVLIKGGDYTKDAIVGAAFVESIGGTVLLAPFVSGYSSTGEIDAGSP